MKKTYTDLFFLVKSGVAGIMVTTALFFFGVTLLQAQQSTARDQIGDLSTTNWKSTAGIDDLVQSETARMDFLISQPDTPDPDRALYRSYKRLVHYIQLGIQNGKQVGDALYDGYEKVVAEAPDDPELKEMPEGALINLVPTLVESLTVTPVPENIQGQ